MFVLALCVIADPRIAESRNVRYSPSCDSNVSRAKRNTVGAPALLD